MSYWKSQLYIININYLRGKFYHLKWYLIPWDKVRTSKCEHLYTCTNRGDPCSNWLVVGPPFGRFTEGVPRRLYDQALAESLVVLLVGVPPTLLMDGGGSLANARWQDDVS